MNVLQTIDLKKYYGSEPNITRALDGVSLSVEQGEFVAIVGTSGNVIKKNDEELTIFRRRNIGFIFQNYNLVPILNVYENIVMITHNNEIAQLADRIIRIEDGRIVE